MIMKKINILLYILPFFLLGACDIQDPWEDNEGTGERINDFELVAPANFANVMLNPGTPAKPVTIEWEEAKTGLGGEVTYNFLMDLENGDFSDPILTVPANNDGKANQVTLNMGDVINAVQQAGVNTFIWTTEAITNHPSGTNMRKAMIPHEITFNVPTVGISDFALLAPAKNEQVTVNTSGDNLVIDWEDATATNSEAVTYQVVFNTEEDFSGTNVVVDADDAGATSSLTVTNKAFMDMLDSLQYTDGIYWQVEASVGEVSFTSESQFVWFEFIRYPNQMFLVGGSTPIGWDPANSLPMVVESIGRFEIFSPLKVIPPDQGNGFKFLEIKDWPGDRGGEPGTRAVENEIISGKVLQEGEENIVVESDGFYRINLNLVENEYTITPSSWGVIGSATPTGWDSDTDMTYVDGFEWTITLDLVPGEMKFRENDGWDVNFGDNNADGSLEKGGANIAIAEAGNYTVNLNLDPAGYSYTLVKN